MWHWSGNLDDDRDVYRALGVGLVEGRGYSSAGTVVPTAYRPPLYPVLLAATGGAHSTLAVGAMNILLGTVTVGFVLAIGGRLPLGTAPALLAGLLTAVDPLLLYYGSFPMTETLCTCLMAAWLWTLLRTCDAAGISQLQWGALSGVLLGLTALCRPTVWACAVLLFAAWAAAYWIRRRAIQRGVSAAMRQREGDAPAEPRRPEDVLRESARRAPRPPGSNRIEYTASVHASAIVALLVAAGLTVAPWAIRNGRVFGRPVVTTTHGGYTLLLGNNSAYYDEVVRQPLGVVWDGSRGPGQAAWAAELNRRLRAEGISGEFERDRWMSQHAWRTMRSNPGTFLRACLRRCLHFWSLVPAVRTSFPTALIWGVGAYYGFVFAAFSCGVVRCLYRSRWLIPLLQIAGFAGVHLVYWSDARMRAPVMPMIALLAAFGVEQVRALAARRRADFNR